MKMKNQKGFSLIELLIVVVIIGIIAAIAIPNLIASRRAANEGSAQSGERMLHSAQVTYAATAGNGTYGTLANLGSTNLIDSVLTGGTKSGYVFSVTKDDGSTTLAPSFVVASVPLVTSGISQTGTRRFCIATDGVIYAYTNTLGTSPVTAATTTTGAVCTAPTSGSGGVIQ